MNYTEIFTPITFTDRDKKRIAYAKRVAEPTTILHLYALFGLVLMVVAKLAGEPLSWPSKIGISALLLWAAIDRVRWHLTRQDLHMYCRDDCIRLVDIAQSAENYNRRLAALREKVPAGYAMAEYYESRTEHRFFEEMAVEHTRIIKTCLDLSEAFNYRGQSAKKIEDFTS